MSLMCRAITRTRQRSRVGKEGDAIIFKVNGARTKETGVWSSAALSDLVLTAATLQYARFYSTVSHDDIPVLAGTQVTAWIGGVSYATTIVTVEGGESAYVIDVPSDDPFTPEIEGGREGDIIVFKVGGVAATQTGIWRAGAHYSIGSYRLSSIAHSRTADDRIVWHGLGRTCCHSHLAPPQTKVMSGKE